MIFTERNNFILPEQIRIQSFFELVEFEGEEENNFLPLILISLRCSARSTTPSSQLSRSYHLLCVSTNSNRCGFSTSPASKTGAPTVIGNTRGPPSGNSFSSLSSRVGAKSLRVKEVDLGVEKEAKRAQTLSSSSPTVEGHFLPLLLVHARPRSR